MKYTLWFILFLFIVSACSDKIDIEDSQAETFNKLYGNSGNDRGCEIKELPNGDFLILATVQTANKSPEIVLIRTDRFGNEQWTKPLGDNVEAEAGGMDIHANGNIIVVGTAFNPGTTEEDSNHTDIIVFELDNNGDVINTDKYSDFLDNEIGKCILFDRGELGGYVLGGSSDALRFATPGFPQNDKGKKDFFFVRKFINELGELEVRDLQIGYDENDEMTSVVQLETDFNFLFAGVYEFNELSRPFLAKIENPNRSTSTNGTLPFNDLNQNATVNKILKIDENQFSIIGYTGNQNTRIIIKFFDSELKTSSNSEYTISKNGSIRGYDIIFNSTTNNFIISGSTNTEGLAKGGGFDHYIASINADDGNINWEKTYGGTGDEEAFAVAPTSDGGYIITGYTGFEGNSLINTIKVNNKGILNP